MSTFCYKTRPLPYSKPKHSFAVKKSRHINRIMKWTARNLVQYPQPICLTQKHIVLAQNLSGNEFFNLMQYAYALIIDRHTKIQSRNHALPCPYEPLLIHLCFFSLSIIRDKYDKKEKRFHSSNSICTWSMMKSHACNTEI